MSSMLSPNSVDPSAIRFKMAVACDICRRRKVKCDGERPCTTCVRTRKDCTFSIPRHVERHKDEGTSPSKKRKRPDAPSSSRPKTPKESSPPPKKPNSSGYPSGRQHLLLIDSDDQLLFSGPSSWIPLFERLGLLKAVESTETGGMLVAFDSHSSDAYGIVGSGDFSNDCLDQCLQACPLRTIYGVFAQYLGFVGRFPLFHIPSVLAELVAVTQRRLPCTPQYGAMLMSVLALAVRTVPHTVNILPDSIKKNADTTFFDLAQKLLRESRNRLDIRYLLALYHLALYSEGQKAAVGQFSSFVAEAIGLAFATGLHRVTSDFEMDPVTSQIRTRLFWALYALDTALTYSNGRPPLLRLLDTTTPLPELVDDQLITKTSIVSKPDAVAPISMLGSRALIELYCKLERVLTIINGIREDGKQAGRSSAAKTLVDVNLEIDELEQRLPDPLRYDASQSGSVHSTSFIWASKVRSTVLFVRTLISRHLLLEDGMEREDTGSTLIEKTRSVCQLSKEIIQVHSVLQHIDLIQQCTFDSVSHLTAAGHTLVACMFKDRSLSLDYRPVLLSAIDILDLLQARYPIAESAARILTDLGRRIGQTSTSVPGTDATMIRILARKGTRAAPHPPVEGRGVDTHPHHEEPIVPYTAAQQTDFGPYLGMPEFNMNPPPPTNYQINPSMPQGELFNNQPVWNDNFSFVNDGLLDLFGSWQ